MESDLHVSEKVNLSFLFQFWFMKYSVQYIIVLEIYLFSLIISWWKFISFKIIPIQSLYFKFLL